jgi:hypothetical protein
MGEDQKENSVPASVVRLLGLRSDNIGSVSIEELAGNVPAVRMVVRQYLELEESNGQLRLTIQRHEGELSKGGENEQLRNKVAALEQQLNIYEDYAKAYATKKSAARIGAFLQLLSSVAVGVGVNLSTPVLSTGGTSLVVLGMIVATTGIYLASKD